MVFFGEGDLDVLLLANGHTHHLLLKTGNELAAANGKGLALGGAAVKLDPIYAAGIVQVYRIAVFHRPVHIHHPGHAFLQLGNGSVHLVVRNIIRTLLYFYTLVRAQLHLGLYRHHQAEYQWGFPFRKGLDGHVGPVHRLYALFRNGSLVSLGIHDIEGVVKKRQGAVHILDHLPGGFALTEAGHVKPFARLLIGLLGRRFELFRRYLDGQLDFAAFELFHSCHFNLRTLRVFFLYWATPKPGPSYSPLAKAGIRPNYMVYRHTKYRLSQPAAFCNAIFHANLCFSVNFSRRLLGRLPRFSRLPKGPGRPAGRYCLFPWEGV